MNAETARIMRVAAQLLDQYFNGELRGQDRVTGFVLIAFPFGEGVRDANYISSGDNTLPVLKELVRRLEERPIQ